MYKALKIPAPSADEIMNVINGTTNAIEIEFERCGKAAGEVFANEFETGFANFSTFLTGKLNDIKDWISKLNPKDDVAWVRDLLDTTALESGYKDLFDGIRIVGSSTFTGLASEMSNLTKEVDDNIKKYQESIKAGTSKDDAQMLFLGGVTIEEYQKRAELIHQTNRKLGN